MPGLCGYAGRQFYPCSSSGPGLNPAASEEWGFLAVNYHGPAAGRFGNGPAEFPDFFLPSAAGH